MERLADKPRRRGPGRRSAAIVLAVLMAAAICSVGTAGADSPSTGIDATYGEAGITKVGGPLGVPAGDEYLEIQSFGPAQDGSAYVVGSVYDCVPFCAGKETNVLSRYESDGSPDASFGGVGSVTLPTPMTHESVIADGPGAAPALVAGVVEGQVVLRRYTADGAVDTGFGTDGSVTLPWGAGYGQLQLLSEPGGRILVDVNAPLKAYEDGTRVRLTRLRANGSLDSGYGTEGTVSFAIHGPGEPRAVVRAGQDATLIGGSGGLGCCQTKHVYLWRVTGDGQVDRRFDRASARSLRRLTALGKYLRLTAIVAWSDGTIAALGTSRGGRAGYYLRLRGGGSLDAGFGRRGLRRLPFTVESAVAGRDGAVFIIGGSTTHPYGGYRAFTVLADGGLDPAYDGARGLEVPLRGVRMEATEVGYGKVLVTDNGNFYCRSGCSSEPAMVRFLG